MLTEYRYIDETRLNSYFEQISSPVMYDKVPTWNADISLTGPKAGTTQARFGRPYTVHEKISKLCEYLEEEQLVGAGRLEYDSSDGYWRVLPQEERPFHIEKCWARRISIPPFPEMHLDGVNLWLSSKDDLLEEGREQVQRTAKPGSLPGNLFLVEDAKRGDEPPDPRSMVSSLSMLLEATDVLVPMDTVEPGSTVEQSLRGFAIDPFRKLSQLGAQVGPRRMIRVLYRIRAIYSDEDLHRLSLPTEEEIDAYASKHGSSYFEAQQSLEAQLPIRWYTSIIGYPIFIAVIDAVREP